jgi:ACT domain-containing protein
MKPRGGHAAGEAFTLELRVAIGQDLSIAISTVLDAFVSERRLLSVGTARQGIAIESSYAVRLRPEQKPDELVKALNRLEGVQNVTIAARTVDEPSA